MSRRRIAGCAAAIDDAPDDEWPTTSSARPSPGELLETPGALLTRGDLAALGLTRTMIDAVFREIGRSGGVVVFPGTRRPAVRREDYLELRRTMHLPRRPRQADVTRGAKSIPLALDGAPRPGRGQRHRPGLDRHP